MSHSIQMNLFTSPNKCDHPYMRLKDLFDDHGRCVTSPLTERLPMKEEDEIFAFPKVKRNYRKLFSRFKRVFKGTDITLPLFYKRGRSLEEQLASSPAFCKLLKGPYQPICLPKMSRFNYDHILKNCLFPVVERYFKNKKNKRKVFSDIRDHEKSPAERVKVNKHSDHKRLLDRCQKGPEHRIALYFPEAFRGISVSEVLGEMKFFPEGFFPAGGIDTIIAILMYPRFTDGGWYSPAITMPGIVSARGNSFYLKSYDGFLGFGIQDPEAKSNCFTSGLVFTGFDT